MSGVLVYGSAIDSGVSAAIIKSFRFGGAIGAVVGIGNREVDE